MTKEITRFDTVIIGLGKTGASCVRYLANQGKSFAVVDSRTHPPELDSIRKNYPDVPVYLGAIDEDLVYAADNLLVSPGVALSSPEIVAAIDKGVNVIGDIELFCRHVTTPIIAITGSNGKSTVASILNSMLIRAGRSVKLGGNIGTPALDLISAEEPDFYILELSSFQLETVNSLNAHAAVVLNVTADHMDRYGSFQEYAQTKHRIYAGDSVMVINIDDEFVVNADKQGREFIFYTKDEPAAGVFGLRTVSGERVLAYGETALVPVMDLPLKGDHNFTNALAALALGTAIDLPMEPMIDALRTFTGLPHRCQWITNIQGVEWYNDSKGTNVGATCAAIRGFCSAGKVILIAGGEGKGADFSPLINVVKEGVRTAILIGRDAKLIAKYLEKETEVCFATTLDAAVQLAADLADEGDIVLLSPACASFDMFADYQARGDAYIDAIHRIESES